MKMFVLALALLAVIPAVSSCSARVRDDDGRYFEVDADGRDYDDYDGDFCPPGQAKKGRC